MTSPGPTIDNSLDDIFGSSPPHEPSRAAEPAPHTSQLIVEPSELPSLRRQHVTAGYRDGISAAKGEHVQEGFDGGFPVGAQLGMRAGTVLGILEGIMRGYESRGGSAVVKKQPARMGASAGVGAAAAGSKKGGGEGQGAKELDDETRRARRDEVLKLYQSAVKALNVQSVFGTLEEGGEDGEGKPSPEPQLAGKDDGIVSNWENRVLVAHWEENMDTLQMKEDGVGEGESQS